MSNVLGCAFKNTGLPSDCPTLFGLETAFGMQKVIADDGTANGFDISASIGTAFLDAFSVKDASKRIFPVTGILNVDQPQEEDQFESDNQNQKTFLRPGILSYSGYVPEVGPVYADKLNGARCVRTPAKYSFTPNGAVGVKQGTSWTPIPIKGFSAQWMPRKGDAVEKVNIVYDYDLALKLGELWLMPYSELGITIQQIQLAGLLDVDYLETVAPSAGASTTASYQLRTDYGQGSVDNQNVPGLSTSDFILTNKNTGLPIVLTTATELPDIQYSFDWPTQTPGDVIRIEIDTTTSGYEGFIDIIEP